MKKKTKVQNNLLVRYWWIGVAGAILLVVAAGKIYVRTMTDNFCNTNHVPITVPPTRPVTAKDWLTMGDYDYESGKCTAAVEDLNKAIAINPRYAQAYNNRGYVKMRLKQYTEALTDLNGAIQLRPDYPHALINRGDIYNYYYSQDKAKAIADYDRVIAMGKDTIKSEPVCGHRLMAVNNGNWLKTMWDTITRRDGSGCTKLFFEK